MFTIDAAAFTVLASGGALRHFPIPMLRLRGYSRRNHQLTDSGETVGT
jgi:hypothetical protein